MENEILKNSTKKVEYKGYKITFMYDQKTRKCSIQLKDYEGAYAYMKYFKYDIAEFLSWIDTTSKRIEEYMKGEWIICSK